MRRATTAIFETMLLVDLHVHLRELRSALQRISVTAAAPFCYASCAMLNTRKPTYDLVSYQATTQKIATSGGNHLWVIPVPLLGDDTTKECPFRWKSEGARTVKLMLAGATVGSHNGVSDLKRLLKRGIFGAVEKAGLVCQMHDEVPGVPSLEAERRFVFDVLPRILRRHPKLKVIVEHAGDADVLRAISTYGANVKASITYPQLSDNYDDVYTPDGRILNAYLHRRPGAKSPEDVEACWDALLGAGGFPENTGKYFVITDLAAHSTADKEGPNPSPGCFPYPAGPHFLAKMLAEYGCLERFPDLTAVFPARAIGIKPPNGKTVLWLVESEWQVPEKLSWGKISVRPWMGGHVFEHRWVRVEP